MPVAVVVLTELTVAGVVSITMALPPNASGVGSVSTATFVDGSFTVPPLSVRAAVET